MIALLLVTLAWTAPAVDSTGAAITVPLEQIVVRQRKPPAAVRLGLNLYAWPDTFAVEWPIIRAEADTEIVAHVYAQPGAPCSVAIDTTGGPWWWNVVSRKSGGRWSGPSNPVRK